MPISSKRAADCPRCPATMPRSASGPTSPALPTGSPRARDSAEEAAGADERSRAALYRALGHAYDFALAAEDAPDDYAELLDDAGLKAQARAPMTPVVKLVFGVALRQDAGSPNSPRPCPGRSARASPPARSPTLLEAHEGGLKGVVAAERAARRPAAEARPLGRDPRRAARRAAARPRRDRRRRATDEFVLLVARRDAGRLRHRRPGRRPALVDQAIRKSAPDRRCQASAATGAMTRRAGASRQGVDVMRAVILRSCSSRLCPPSPPPRRPPTVEVQLSSFAFTPERDPSARRPAGDRCTSSTAAVAATISRRPNSSRPRPASPGRSPTAPSRCRGHQSVDITLTPARGTYRLRCTHTMHTAFGMSGAITVE